MSKIPFVLALLISTSVLSSCTHTTGGPKIESTKLESIKEGVTTKQEVMDILGQPTSVINSAGRTSFQYNHSTVHQSGKGFIPVAGLWLGRATGESQIVMISFDENDVVSNITSTESQNDFGGGMGTYDPK